MKIKKKTLKCSMAARDSEAPTGDCCAVPGQTLLHAVYDNEPVISSTAFNSLQQHYVFHSKCNGNVRGGRSRRVEMIPLWCAPINTIRMTLLTDI